MQFIPDSNKQADEVYFLRNPNTEDFTPIKLNVSPVQGTSRESLYKEIGLESLQCRLWYWKILFFYKILKV